MILSINEWIWIPRRCMRCWLLINSVDRSDVHQPIFEKVEMLASNDWNLTEATSIIQSLWKKMNWHEYMNMRCEVLGYVEMLASNACNATEATSINITHTPKMSLLSHIWPKRHWSTNLEKFKTVGAHMELTQITKSLKSTSLLGPIRSSPKSPYHPNLGP